MITKNCSNYSYLFIMIDKTRKKLKIDVFHCLTNTNGCQLLVLKLKR